VAKLGLWREFAGERDGSTFGCGDGIAIGDLDGRAKSGGLNINAVLFCGGIKVVAGGAGVYNCGVVCLVIGGGWD
jgi:hypothetical protein